MPTFYDPGAVAVEASDALRGLGHATRTFENPQDLYGVLGDRGWTSPQKSSDYVSFASDNACRRKFTNHGT